MLVVFFDAASSDFQNAKFLRGNVFSPRTLNLVCIAQLSADDPLFSRLQVVRSRFEDPKTQAP